MIEKPKTSVACASDIHGMWGLHAGLKNKQGDLLKPHLVAEKYPQADFLVLAGDILANYAMCRGEYDEIAMQLNELDALNDFYKGLKQDGVYKEVFFVAGNHDWAFQRAEKLCRDRLKDVVYLQDEEANIGAPDGSILKIYGSPWQRWFYDWAFNFPNHNRNMFRARAHARACWEKIPDNTDILITHGPALHVLDECMDGSYVGDEWLGERIKELKQLKLHVCGHIHHSRGQLMKDDVLRVNASVCTEQYRPDNPIQVVQI